MEREPRFVVDSIDELIKLAQRADPPVQPGDVAEVALPRRRVRVQVRSVGSEVLWEEMR